MTRYTAEQMVREAGQRVAAALDKNFNEYQEELGRYGEVVDQAVEAGMDIEEIKRIEIELGFYEE